MQLRQQKLLMSNIFKVCRDPVIYSDKETIQVPPFRPDSAAGVYFFFTHVDP